MLKKIGLLCLLQPSNFITVILISGGYPMVPYKQQCRNQRDMMIFGFILGLGINVPFACINSGLIGLYHFSKMEKTSRN
jgi:hypothetical protein